jgi:hypothetical protein
MRSSGCSPRRTSAKPSSVSSSSRCGSSNSRRCATATAFFYLNDPELGRIEQRYGIDYRKTLAEIIRLNTGEKTQADVFKAPLG